MGFKLAASTALRSLIGYQSYAAAGEDRLVMAWLRVCRGMNLKDVRYCDIGANHPKYLSNTFALYRAGARGVLVEPDPNLCAKLRRSRPKDTVLNIGAAFDDRRSAKLKRMSYGVFNTFLPEQADLIVESSKGWGRADKQRVIDEIEVQLLPTNQILAENFADGIDFLSIDTEGCNTQILQSIDLEKFRPKIICVEASDDFTSLMASSGYEMIARSPDNVIFHSLK